MEFENIMLSDIGFNYKFLQLLLANAYRSKKKLPRKEGKNEP